MQEGWRVQGFARAGVRGVWIGGLEVLTFQVRFGVSGIRVSGSRYQLTDGSSVMV